jgi:hypothetical protein
MWEIIRDSFYRCDKSSRKACRQLSGNITSNLLFTSEDKELIK